MTGKGKENSAEAVRKRIQTEIIPVLYQAPCEENIKFLNPHVVPCWIKKECARIDCPAYENMEVRCWYTAGTYCGGAVQGTFADKYGNCRKCAVFQESCPTLVEEVGEALNNMLSVLDKEKQSNRKQMQKIEYLNKELLSSLENLDARNREIQELVITDKLTGLYNRQYLSTILEDEVNRSQRGKNPLTVMMLDVDDFKNINDLYGHTYGDRILSCLGRVLRDSVRKSDRPFRYGGEEFLVVLPDTDSSVAWIVAERIRKAFEREHFSVKPKDGIQKTFSLTLSIGVAGYVQGVSVSALIKRADEAMYQAKSEGKNRSIRYMVD